MTISLPELAQICRGFSLLLHSGIGAADAAFLLAQEATPPMDSLLQSLGEDLDRGSPLWEALKKTGTFPDYLLAMVRIGEETGHLEESLNSLGTYYEERCRRNRQIRSAVAYPAMLMGLMLLVIGVLLVKVLPIFDRVYASLGTRLTGPAAALLYTGQMLDVALPVLFIILLAAAAIAGYLSVSPALRKTLVSAWIKRYGDRGLGRKFSNARLARALAMGLSSGLPVETAMALAQNLLQDNPGAARRCHQCRRDMEHGTDPVTALETAQLLPPAQCRLLQIGIRSGSADRVMAQIADAMEEEAQETLEKRIACLEPAMVLICSLLVGLILLSVMLPLADILTVLG